MPANLKIVTAAQMSALEQAAEQQGVPTDALMETAGLAVAQYARQQLNAIAGANVVVLVGPGNNGADGLVAARHLRRWGAEVTACLLTRRPDLDPKLDLARDYGVSTLSLADANNLDHLSSLLSRSHLVIDAVLGTGRSRPLQGLVREALLLLSAARQQRHPPLLLALDLPTGLSADTGAIDDATPIMDATLALGFPKAGLLAFPGAGRVGQLATLDIGLPDAVGQENIPLELLTPAWVGSRLPPRPLDSHKGTYGHLLVVAGSRHYVGAACLVARAAHRAGAGLVTLATPQSVYPIAAAQLTETIHLPLPEDAHGRIHPDAAAIIRDALPRYDALALGSGLGLSDSTVNFIEKLLLDNPSPNLPVLVDADGLNCLARSSNWWQRCSGPLVLTPHPGEMSTLTGQSTAAIQQDRVAAARHWAAAWQAILVLKGAFTAIAQPGPKLDLEPGVVPGTEPGAKLGAEPETRPDANAAVKPTQPAALVRLSPYANPGLAAGGSGDVLTGIIASLLAQGLSPLDAASCGVYLHAHAAQTLTNARGPVGLLPSELPNQLPQTINSLRHSV